MDDDTAQGPAPAPPVTPFGTTPQDAGPVRESERIQSLDVLRGVAILGIFIVNIVGFAVPFSVLLDPERLLDEPRGELVAWAVVTVLALYKFISLFSLLFGAGMMMQMQRAARSGTPFMPRYLRRIGVLACFGLIHAFLIWYGDILLLYAVVGLLLLAFAGLTARQLVWLAGVALLLGMLFYGAIAALGVLLEQYDNDLSAHVEDAADAGAAAVDPDLRETGATVEDDRLERFFAALKASQADPTDPDFERAEHIAYGEGPFLAALIMRAISYLILGLFAYGLGGIGLRVLGLFLLGAALMKSGFFSEAGRPWHRRLCLLGIPLGLALELLGAGLMLRAEFRPNMVLVGAALLQYVASFVLCMGYLGGICMFVSSGAWPRLQAGLAAVGRMALTNYLAQSIIATGVFYWWGLGLFGEWGRVQQLGLVAGVFVGQVIFSVLWLRVFRFGPLEWAWRVLTYLRWQPLLRQA